MTGFLLTIDRLKPMKHHGFLAIPHANAGHRTEIIARFFGWRTYAALLHAVRLEGQLINEFDFDCAIEFSRKIGVNVGREDLEELAERLETAFGTEADYRRN